MTIADKALEAYDAALRLYEESGGYDALNQLPDLLNAAQVALEEMRGEREEKRQRKLAPKPIQLVRERLVSADFNIRNTDTTYRKNSLRNQAVEDNDHNPSEKWMIRDLVIVHTGPEKQSVEGSDHNVMVRVFAKVTEIRTATFSG